MNFQRSYRRRVRQCFAVCAGCIAFFAGLLTQAQSWEFQRSQLRGRLDNPACDNLWRMGDVNGNGTIDEDETVGQYFELDWALHQAPPPVRTINVPYYDFIGYAHTTPGTLSGGGNGVVDDVIYLFPYYEVHYATIPAPPVIESHSYARSSGAQLMYALAFADAENPTTAENLQTLEISAGARFFNLMDRSILSNFGLASSLQTDSTLDCQSLGPQLAVDWSRRRGRFATRVGAAASIAYAQMDGRQDVSVVELLPGGLNRPVFLAAPLSIEHTIHDDDFLPMAEVGAQASFDLSRSVVCFARCDAIYFGDMRQARDAVNFSLPQMGLTDRGGTDVTSIVGTLGIEVRR